MRTYALIISLLFLSSISFSQNTNTTEKNSVGNASFYAEGGGAGIVFSANGDFRFKGGRLGWGGRLGMGFVSAYNDYYDPVTGYYYSGDQSSALTVPVQVNYIFGKNNSPHTFEVGGGGTYVSKKLNIMDYYYSTNKDRRTNFFGTFAFMYRRQPINGGFSWRIGFTPLFAKGYIQPFGAASVGYNF